MLRLYAIFYTLALYPVDKSQGNTARLRVFLG
jgi:hypothetical protein